MKNSKMSHLIEAMSLAHHLLDEAARAYDPEAPGGGPLYRELLLDATGALGKARIYRAVLNSENIRKDLPAIYNAVSILAENTKRSADTADPDSPQYWESIRMHRYYQAQVDLCLQLSEEEYIALVPYYPYYYDE